MKLVSFLVFALPAAFCGFAKDIASLSSPDGRWKASIASLHPLVIELRDRDGRLLVSQQAEMQLADRSIPSAGATVTGVSTRSVDAPVEPPVREIAKTLRERYNEVGVSFSDRSTLAVRLYDEGLAYRFGTLAAGAFVVRAEERVLRFDGDPTVYFGRDRDFYSANEVSYDVRKLSGLAEGDQASLPLTVRAAGSDGLLVFSETALEDYPGEWMRVGKGALKGVNPGYPAKEAATDAYNLRVLEREKYIARGEGPRVFPWRTVAVAARDAELLGNALNFLAAEPSRLADVSWIRPGKVQWDWWHNWTWEGRKLPISNETYKRYVDFAAAHRIPYVLLDEGWADTGDLTRRHPGIDVPALVRYAAGRRVDILLWVSWVTLRRQFDEMMPVFEKWGVKGLKVDFFQRDDQPAVAFYWKLAKEAARRRLVLDFHGAHKPAGLQRTYPNALTFEGVRGLEQNKGGSITPTHDLQLPFTRMVAGPMDYTPGAMRNSQPEAFHADNSAPMSMGTRCHELAKYVLFESPLQMLCDAPPHYEREKGALAFLEAVPTAWDETRPLAGRIGEYAAIARRSGDTWFLAAMTNETARALEIDFSQLGKGPFIVTAWQDGPKAGVEAADCEQRQFAVKAGEKISISLARSGGWVAVAVPAKPRL